MNSQTTRIRIIDNKADIGEVIRRQKLTKSYPCGNALVADQLGFELQSHQ
jgi:hypothetical protein